ncbi:16227_t:CDS:1, partial [Cetraspora pellucida]
PEGRGRGRKQSSRKSVIGHFEYSSDSARSKSRKSTSDGESIIYSSPAASLHSSFHEEQTDWNEINHYDLEINQKNIIIGKQTAEIEQLKEKIAELEKLNNEKNKRIERLCEDNVEAASSAFWY